MAGSKSLKKGEILFREGDPSDCMYVIKSGRIAITKAKGSSEIELAELGPGDMLGEMAFFDNRPRSAGAKAKADTVVIVLPFKALHAQFKTLPEWIKAIVKTVNNHLRAANQRIKNLEQASSDEEQFFQPHTVTRLCAILVLVATKYGENDETGVVVPSGTLRRFTIQIFQQPTHKMQTLMEILASQNYLTIEDLGEGRQKLTILRLNDLSDFVEFYNDYLFKEESKRTTIEQKELRVLRALVFYGGKAQANEKGEVAVNITAIQNDSMRDLGNVISVNDYATLMEKNVVGDTVSEKGFVSLKFNYKEVSRIFPYWELIHTLANYRGSRS